MSHKPTCRYESGQVPRSSFFFGHFRFSDNTLFGGLVPERLWRKWQKKHIDEFLVLSEFSTLSHEREEVQLPVRRMETTVDRQVDSIDKESVLTCEKLSPRRRCIKRGRPHFASIPVALRKLFP
jgi:hypothetical protein